MLARIIRLAAAGVALAALLPLLGADNPLPPREAERVFEAYREVIDRTAGMVRDDKVRALAKEHGLDVLDLTWEDMARWKNSAVGPNISDMTIQVQQRHPGTKQLHLTCMPVIRHPNFSDRTVDIRPENFHVVVGNERGQPGQRVNLQQYLGNLRLYLSKPGSWKGTRTSLLARRDTHVLVSAQACFLPIPRAGLAEFTPVLFNYQSYPDNPAVLAILATPEGTSANIVDNNDRDRIGSGQRLLFNQKGERAVLTGRRFSDLFPLPGKDSGGKPPETGPTVDAAGQAGANVVLLIQVPLRWKEPPRRALTDKDKSDKDKASPKDLAPPRRSDVENAVIGHGKVEGPFRELGGLPIERDERFPVRVTVQFYKATSNGVVTASDMAAIAGEVRAVYSKGEYAGSLVTQGKTDRPTEHEVHPPQYWDEFWARFEKRKGLSREDVVARLQEEKGLDWFPITEVELSRVAETLPPGQARAQQRFEINPGVWIVPIGLAVLLLAGLLYLRSRRARLSGS